MVSSRLAVEYDSASAFPLPSTLRKTRHAPPHHLPTVAVVRRHIAVRVALVVGRRRPGLEALVQRQRPVGLEGDRRPALYLARRQWRLVLRGGAGGWLATTEPYKNFESELEVRLPPGGNSGVFCASRARASRLLTAWRSKCWTTSAAIRHDPALATLRQSLWPGPGQNWLHQEGRRVAEVFDPVRRPAGESDPQWHGRGRRQFGGLSGRQDDGWQTPSGHQADRGAARPSEPRDAGRVPQYSHPHPSLRASPAHPPRGLSLLVGLADRPCPRRVASRRCLRGVAPSLRLGKCEFLPVIQVGPFR